MFIALYCKGVKRNSLQQGKVRNSYLHKERKHITLNEEGLYGNFYFQTFNLKQQFVENRNAISLFNYV